MQPLGGFGFAGRRFCRCVMKNIAQVFLPHCLWSICDPLRRSSCYLIQSLSKLRGENVTDSVSDLRKLPLGFWRTLKTAGFYLQLFILCYALLLNSNIFLGCCIRVPYRNWDCVNKEQNMLQVLVFWQSGFVCSLSFPHWGIPRVETRGLNSILLMRRCWWLSSFPTDPLWHGFHSCGRPLILLILLAGSHHSQWGLTKWFLSNSLGPPQGRTLQKKTTLWTCVRKMQTAAFWAECCTFFISQTLFTPTS